MDLLGEQDSFVRPPDWIGLDLGSGKADDDQTWIRSGQFFAVQQEGIF
jgi:hypothetical protein